MTGELLPVAPLGPVSLFKHVRCEQCGHEYLYRMDRNTVEWLVDPFVAHKDVSETNAALDDKLTRACDPVPCPECGWYQRYMIPQARRLRYRWMGPVAWLLLLLAILATLPVLVGVWFPLAVCLSISPALFLAKWILQVQHDPNQGEVEQRKQQGRQRVTSKEAALSGLVCLLTHRHPTVRCHAATTLGQLGPEAREAVPALINTLQDEKWQVRWSAVEAVGRMGADRRKAIPALIERLQDEHGTVRCSAGWTLAQIGCNEEGMDLYEPPDYPVSNLEKAREALALLDAGPGLRELPVSNQEEAREALAAWKRILPEVPSAHIPRGRLPVGGVRWMSLGAMLGIPAGILTAGAVAVIGGLLLAVLALLKSFLTWPWLGGLFDVILFLTGFIFFLVLGFASSACVLRRGPFDKRLTPWGEVTFSMLCSVGSVGALWLILWFYGGKALLDGLLAAQGHNLELSHLVMGGILATALAGVTAYCWAWEGMVCEDCVAYMETRPLQGLSLGSLKAAVSAIAARDFPRVMALMAGPADDKGEPVLFCCPECGRGYLELNVSFWAAYLNEEGKTETLFETWQVGSQELTPEQVDRCRSFERSEEAEEKDESSDLEMDRVPERVSNGEMNVKEEEETSDMEAGKAMPALRDTPDDEDEEAGTCPAAALHEPAPERSPELVDGMREELPSPPSEASSMSLSQEQGEELAATVNDILGRLVRERDFNVVLGKVFVLVVAGLGALLVWLTFGSEALWVGVVLLVITPAIPPVFRQFYGDLEGSAAGHAVREFHQRFPEGSEQRVSALKVWSRLVDRQDLSNEGKQILREEVSRNNNHTRTQAWRLFNLSAFAVVLLLFLLVFLGLAITKFITDDPWYFFRDYSSLNEPVRTEAPQAPSPQEHERTEVPWAPGPQEPEDPTLPELLSLQGHTGPVRSVCFSTDGKRLATGSEDRTVKVWDARTGQQVLSFSGHTDDISGVVFNADGTQLASASPDQTVKVWDAKTGQQLRTLQGHPSSVRSVCYSPKGMRLASVSVDGTVKVWDAKTGRQLVSCQGHSNWVRSVCFSPDGKRLATASGDHTIKVWDATKGQEVLSLKGHTRGVYSVTFSPDGKHLASGSGDETLKVWNAQSGQEALTLTGHVGLVISVRYSPDGTRIASASIREVKIWDAQTGKEALTLVGHSDVVWDVCFSPDGTRIATASGDNTVKVWDVSDLAGSKR